MVFIHVIRGRPSGLLQFPVGEDVKKTQHMVMLKWYTALHRKPTSELGASAAIRDPVVLHRTEYCASSI